MTTAHDAYDSLKDRNLPYWKLYKGPAQPGNKVSQCDETDNPTADPDVAAELFEKEIKTRLRTPGNYTVNVFRKINGEKGGYKYEFTISQNERQMNFSNSSIPQHETEYQRIRREINVEDALKRIEDKVDSILQYIVASQTEEKKDDNEALKLIGGLLAKGMMQKTPLPSGQSFNSLK